MKTTIYLTLALLCLCISCKMPQYIPTETVKTEYRDNFVRDSIYRYDSIFVKEKGDTLIMERYRYLYRDKFIRDSIFINDTIRVPYPVEVPKQTRKPLTGWQNFQIWSGRIALVIGLFAIIYFVLRLKKKVLF
jgi:hypothetical protein